LKLQSRPISEDPFEGRESEVTRSLARQWEKPGGSNPQLGESPTKECATAGIGGEGMVQAFLGQRLGQLEQGGGIHGMEGGGGEGFIRRLDQYKGCINMCRRDREQKKPQGGGSMCREEKKYRADHSIRWGSRAPRKPGKNEVVFQGLLTKNTNKRHRAA